jgi:hypothetical protein
LLLIRAVVLAEAGMDEEGSEGEGDLWTSA